jgi:hypothetical protein
VPFGDKNEALKDRIRIGWSTVYDSAAHLSRHWQMLCGTSSMMPFRCARTICASAVTRAALSGQLEDARPVLAGRSVLHVANAPTKLPPFDRGGVLPCLVSLLHWPRYDTGTVSLFVIAFASPSGSSRFY